MSLITFWVTVGVATSSRRASISSARCRRYHVEDPDGGAAPAWVKWVDEPVPGYPKRTVPRDEDAAKALKKRTLTKSLQRPPADGLPMCTTLDAAVAAAYGWSADIDDDHVLRELLALDSGGA